MENLSLNSKSDLIILRTELESAIKVVGDKLGLKMETGGIVYSGSNATIKVLASTINEDGSVNEKEADDFRVYARGYGLEADDLGKTFTARGTRYTLVGCKPRSTKYPLLGERADGKRFKFTRETVKSRLITQ